MPARMPALGRLMRSKSTNVMSLLLPHMLIMAMMPCVHTLCSGNANPISLIKPVKKPRKGAY